MVAGMKISFEKSINMVALRDFLGATQEYRGAVLVTENDAELLLAVKEKFENRVVFEDRAHVLCGADGAEYLEILKRLKDVFSCISLKTMLQHPNFDPTLEKFFEYAPDFEQTAEVIKKINDVGVDEIILEECGSIRVIWQSLKRDFVTRLAQQPIADYRDILKAILAERCGGGAESVYEFLEFCKKDRPRETQRLVCVDVLTAKMLGERLLDASEELYMHKLLEDALANSEDDTQSSFIKSLFPKFDEKWTKYRTNRFEFELTSDGIYEFIMEFKGYSHNSVNYVYLDGMTMGYFKSPGKDKQFKMFTLDMKAGEHCFELIQKWGNTSYDMDCIIRRVECNERECEVDFDTLVTPEPMACVTELMQYFKSVYGRKIILGQHTKDREMSSYRQIQELTGKSPALLGMELLSYSGNLAGGLSEKDSAAEIEINMRTVDTVIEHLKAKGGILTCTWHWFSPIGGHGKSFYSDFTNFDTCKAVTEGTEEYEAAIRDIDIIAEQLKKFQKENIPILWRPLHEAEGAWFWWGKDGADACKKLYRIIFERMTEHHKLKNLIWVWNSVAPEWYPGNDVVDIISIDKYVEQRRPGIFAVEYGMECDLNKAMGAKKPIALGEFGCAPHVEAQNLGVKWLYGMSWNGVDYMDNEYGYLQTLYNSENTVTLKDLPKNIRYPNKK